MAAESTSTAVVHVPPPASTPEGQLLAALVVARRSVPHALEGGRHHQVLAETREVLLREGLVLELGEVSCDGLVPVGGDAQALRWRAAARLAHVGGGERSYRLELLAKAGFAADAVGAELDRQAHLRVLGLAVLPAPEAEAPPAKAEQHAQAGQGAQTAQRPAQGPVEPPRRPAQRDQRSELAASHRRQLQDVLNGQVLRAATPEAVIEGITSMLEITGTPDVAEHAWSDAIAHVKRLELPWRRIVTAAQKKLGERRRARVLEDQFTGPADAVGSKID